MNSKVILEGLVFPECPRWKNSRLWFSNIFGNQVISIYPSGKIDKILNISSIGIGWLPDDTFIYVPLNKQDQSIMKYKSGESTPYSNKLCKLSPYMFNDLVVSYTGIAYTGNTGCNADSRDEWSKLSPAPIALIKPDGSVLTAATDLLGPNGMIITPDNKRLIVAEPNGHRLTSFDIKEDGTLDNRSIFAQLKDYHKPDGICLDKDGAVWAASGCECIRVKEGGEITHRVETVGKSALACMLGGPQKTTLFICTKDLPVDDLDYLIKMKTGKIEAVEVKSAPGVGKP